MCGAIGEHGAAQSTLPPADLDFGCALFADGGDPGPTCLPELDERVADGLETTFRAQEERHAPVLAGTRVGHKGHARDTKTLVAAGHGWTPPDVRRMTFDLVNA